METTDAITQLKELCVYIVKAIKIFIIITIMVITSPFWKNGDKE